jgi:hypothetical protein
MSYKKNRRNTADIFSHYEQTIDRAVGYIYNKDIREWYKAEYGEALFGHLYSSTEPYRLLDDVFQDVNELGKEIVVGLEGYEEYELCAQVETRRKQLLEQVASIEIILRKKR